MALSKRVIGKKRTCPLGIKPGKGESPYKWSILNTLDFFLGKCNPNACEAIAKKKKSRVFLTNDRLMQTN